PRNGHYVLVSAQEEALIELTPSGEVVSARSLPGGHAHTEGVAITKDGILIISDEAGKSAAAITLYRRR
ncbi:MAG TPA: SdiA-regulated domain-containing protein, partial [Gemmatimonadales bacterium]|nr:SdiA-regulated domain-containing protein [Gemmatimonadales bacterium]